MHRQDLQIISIGLFNRVQEMIKSRSDKSKNAKGVKGRYIFTGFVVCGNCGGPMVAANRGKDSIFYQCVNRRNHGPMGCSASKNYTEYLILPPVIEKITDIIQSHLDFRAAMNEAAAQFGKSVTEEALEAAIQGELESVRAGKQRLIEAISLGVLTADEAATKLAEREQEQRLTVEIASIGEKTAIMESWQIALDSLESKSRAEIVVRLQSMAQDTPLAFRRFLSLIFEPNSLRVRTERMEGSLKWRGVLEGYELTEAMKEMQQGAVSFATNLRR